MATLTETIELIKVIDNATRFRAFIAKHPTVLDTPYNRFLYSCHEDLTDDQIRRSRHIFSKFDSTNKPVYFPPSKTCPNGHIGALN
jgi:hypothetical protein